MRGLGFPVDDNIRICRMVCASARELRSSPGFVFADVVHDVEPFGNEGRGMVTVIDLRDEGPVLVLVDCDDQSVPLNDVPSLADEPDRQCAKDAPLLVVQVEVRASDFCGPFGKANLVSQLADHGPVTCTYLA